MQQNAKKLAKQSYDDFWFIVSKIVLIPIIGLLGSICGVDGLKFFTVFGELVVFLMIIWIMLINGLQQKLIENIEKKYSHSATLRKKKGLILLGGSLFLVIGIIILNIISREFDLEESGLFSTKSSFFIFAFFFGFFIVDLIQHIFNEKRGW